MSNEQLPPVDVVLISHDRYDYLYRTSLLALSNIANLYRSPTLFLVPLGVEVSFDHLDVENVTEFDWRDSANVKDVEFNFTPAQHRSAKGLDDRSQTLSGDWAMFGKQTHWYFSGGTGCFHDYTDTQKLLVDRQTPAKMVLLAWRQLQQARTSRADS